MEELLQTHTTEEDKKDGQLKAILYLLQTKLEERVNEVDRSYSLLKIGEKTDLTKELESSINDPFGAISKMTGKIDQSLKAIVDTVVRAFFKSRKEKILHVYKSATAVNDLHYSIVLKNDDIDNRNAIFDFFDAYDLHEASRKYPVYFQFTPIELVAKIKVKEEILLD